MKQTIWSTKELNLNQVSKLKHAGNPILIKSFLIFFHSPQFKFNFNNLTNWATTTTITIKMNWINELWISIWNVAKTVPTVWHTLSTLRMTYIVHFASMSAISKILFLLKSISVYSESIYVSTVFIRIRNQLIYALYHFLIRFTYLKSIFNIKDGT